MNKKYSWVYYLITPILLALWLYTGQNGWYNILATYISIVFAIVSIVGVVMFACITNEVKFVTQKMQDSILKMKFVGLSRLINICYSCILIWHDKFVIASMMIIMVFVGLWINNYVMELKSSELAPEKEPVL